ncbi:hypothetical protein BDW66DRAFT_128921 [Aspergillus desertorum]
MFRNHLGCAIVKSTQSLPNQPFKCRCKPHQFYGQPGLGDSKDKIVSDDLAFLWPVGAMIMR